MRGNGWFSSYLPVNEEAKRWGIYCQDAGRTVVPPHSPYPLVPSAHPRAYAAAVTTGRVLSEYQLVYISDGRGRFWSESTGNRSVSPGTTFLLSPGVRHAYRPDTDSGWTEWWVGFSGGHVQRLADDGFLDRRNPLTTVGFHSTLIALFETVFEICARQEPSFQLRLGAIILHILALCRSYAAEDPAPLRSIELVQRSREIMERSVDVGVSVTELAAECRTSYEGLIRTFRNVTGLTPYQYFQQLRLSRAMQLLAQPQLRIKDVADILHFDNQYYFARSFKRRTGTTPSEWRAARFGE